MQSQDRALHYSASRGKMGAVLHFGSDNFRNRASYTLGNLAVL